MPERKKMVSRKGNYTKFVNDLKKAMDNACDDDFTKVVFTDIPNRGFRIVEDKEISTVDTSEPKVNDPVNHPSHYTHGGIEVLDFIKAYFMHNYHLGQVCKYISRAGFKDPAKELEDLKKAQFYLNDYIKVLEERGK